MGLGGREIEEKEGENGTEGVCERGSGRGRKKGRGNATVKLEWA